MYTLHVFDDGDNFTLNVQGGTTENYTLTEGEEGEYIFTWNLQHVIFSPLVFVANDSRGAVSTFEPTVEICACVNDGVCTKEGVITSNSTILLNCICNEGNYITCA